MEKVSVSKETARQIVESGVDLDQLIEEKLPPVNVKKGNPYNKQNITFCTLGFIILFSGFIIFNQQAKLKEAALELNFLQKTNEEEFLKLSEKEQERRKWRRLYFQIKDRSAILVSSKKTANPMAEVEEKTRLSKQELLSWVNPRNGANIAHHHMSRRNTTPAEWERLIAAGVNINQQRKAWVKGEVSENHTGPTPLMAGILAENWKSVIYLLTHHRDKLDLGITNNSGRTAHDYIKLKIENGANVPDEIEKLLL